MPVLGAAPVELGFAGHDEAILPRIAADPCYPGMFAAAFPDGDGEISLATVVRALAAFERTIFSLRSPYDRYRYEGDVDAVSDAEVTLEPGVYHLMFTGL